MNYYNDPLYVLTKIKKLAEGEATVALSEAWKKAYNRYPNNNQLALLWSQSCLETGRWKIIRNYNFGNIKKKHTNKKYKIKDDGHKFTMFSTGENLWNNKKKKTEWHWFNPPHIQTHFRAYDTATQGAYDYLCFVSKKKRYIKAWQKVLAGDPEGYSHELHKAGYYTCPEKTYTKGVVRLTNEFLKKADKLLTWEPEVPQEPDVPKELFTKEERKEILTEAGLATGQSIEEYFANSNNYTPDDDEIYQHKKPWWRIF